MTLSPQEIERYSRQLILHHWGARQQERLRNLSVHLPPMEALISYLAASGIGEIRVVPELDPSLPTDIDIPKLSRLNPEVKIIFDKVPLSGPPLQAAAEEHRIVIAASEQLPLVIGSPLLRVFYGKAFPKIDSDYRKICGPEGVSQKQGLLIGSFLAMTVISWIISGGLSTILIEI